MFSINADLKSGRSARWNLSHGIFIKLSTGLGTQRDTKFIHDTVLALEGLTALVWLGDHPTSTRMEKPNLHFGFLVLHEVTGQETRRASVPVEGLGGLQPLSLRCINSTSSLAAESRWLFVHKHCHFTGTATSSLNLGFKEHWPYSCCLPFFEAYGFALRTKVKTSIKQQIWPTAPQTQPKTKP